MADVRETSADLLVRSLYAGYQDSTLEEMLAIGRTFEPKANVVAMNEALERELERRKSEREGGDGEAQG